MRLNDSKGGEMIIVKRFRFWIFIFLDGRICFEHGKVIKVNIFRCLIFIFLEGYICLESRIINLNVNLSKLNFYFPVCMFMSRTEEKWKKWKFFQAEFLFYCMYVYVSNGGEMKKVKSFWSLILFSWSCI